MVFLLTFIRMKRVLIIPILCIIGCSQPQSTYKISTVDSISNRVKATKMAHDMIEEAKTKAVSDLYSKSKMICPVTIKKCYITKDEYGAADINVSIKNTSNKVIDGIKISWILYNNFNEQVDNSNGIAQEKISQGKSTTYSWSIYQPATHAKAFVYSIHFTDGSSWRLQGTY